MTSFKAIAAMSLNRVIGAGNKIPWHLPQDFKWFKQMTTGHIIVMGRKTFESIGKPLPNRTTVVLSRGNFSFPGVKVVHNLDELIQPATAPPPHPALSPGGGEDSRNQDFAVRTLEPPLHPAFGHPLPHRGRGQGEGATGNRAIHGEGVRRKDVGTVHNPEAGIYGVPGQRNIFICGGAEVYAQALPQCSDLYLTLVKREVEGGTFFPRFEDRFDLVEEIQDGPEFKILHYRNRTMER